MCRSCAALTGQSNHNFDKFGNEILLCQKLAQESGENEGVQAKLRNAHAATALPTFTLSGSPISHSIKYALKMYYLDKWHEIVQKSHLRYQNLSF